MILSFLGKYWKNILDALIIIAIVLVVFFINPFGIFGGGLKLQHTANHVSSIKQIGQLVTSEYYGEVISSISKARLSRVVSRNVDLEADSVFVSVKQDLLKIYRGKEAKQKVKKEINLGFFKIPIKNKDKDLIKKIRKKELFDDYLAINKNFEKDSLQLLVLEYFWRSELSKVKKLDKDSKTKDNKKALHQLLTQIVEKEKQLNVTDFDQYMRSGLQPSGEFTKFSGFFKAKYNAQLGRKESQKELSMIGRGWVKAGFNFGLLDERNLILDEDNGVVHVFGIEAEILNVDINPWFIPEAKVPGFQIINANNKVDFRDAKLVKLDCISKLETQARQSGILEHANNHGKEVLKNFLSLISGVEIKEVHLHNDPFASIYKNLQDDGFINYAEGLKLDSLINREIALIDSLRKSDEHVVRNQKAIELKLMRLEGVMSHLRTLEFAFTNAAYGRLSTATYRIIVDGFVTTDELETLKAKKVNLHNWQNLPDSSLQTLMIWYADSLEFINEYNQSVDFVLRQSNRYGNLLDTILEKGADTAFMNDFKKLFVVKTDSTYAASYLVPDTGIRAALNTLKYAVKPAGNWSSMVNSDAFLRSLKKGDKPDSSHLLTIDNEAYFVHHEFVMQFSTAASDSNFIRITRTQIPDTAWLFNSQPLTSDEQIVFTYLFNRFKLYQSRGPVSKFSDAVKERFNRDNMKQKTSEIQQSAYGLRKEIKSWLH